MNQFRRTELLFFGLGGGIMLVALILLQSDLMVFMRSHQTWSDPFAAKYAPVRVIAIPQSTPAPPPPAQTISTEELFRKEISKIELKQAKAVATPSTITQTASRVRRAYEKEKIYLLHPRHQAILGGLGNPQRGYTVKFQFEAAPKDTLCTLEVMSRGKVVYSKELPNNGTGTYDIPVQLKKTGLYQWKVKSPGFKGHFRYFTIR